MPAVFIYETEKGGWTEMDKHSASLYGYVEKTRV